MTIAHINGIDMDYRVEGSGPPLVWISGTGMSGEAWHKWHVPYFAERYRCITYDLRGCGKSDCPDGEYSARVLAEDLRGLLDHLDIESAHLAGFSLGSCTIQEFALAYPARVKSAILISTWSSTAREHHIKRHYESRLTALQHGPIEVFRAFAFWMFAPSLMDEDYQRVLEVEKFFGTIAGARDLRGYVGHFQADLAHETLDRLGDIRCPTLVLYGAEDLITRPDYNQRVAAAVPGAKIAEIARGGHLAVLEHPDAANAAIDEFLAALP